MPLPRFETLDQARRDAILRSASDEFASCGFSGASYNTIIRNAGLSKGAMYYYFADKADLCRTVLEQVFEELYQEVGDVGDFDDVGSYWAAIHDLTERAAAVMFQRPDLAALSRLTYGEGSSSSVLDAMVQRAEVWVTRLLERGQAVAAVREDLPLAYLAATAMGVLVHADRFLALQLESTPPAELERLSLATLDLVERLVRPENGTRAQPEKKSRKKKATKRKKSS